MYLVGVVCCQVDTSTSSWSLVQRSSTECCVSECGCEISTLRMPWHTRGCCALKNTFLIYNNPIASLSNVEINIMIFPV
jgi:hypothetical protein